MLTQYFTVNAQGHDEQVIQKSRFIGYVQRVETEESAIEFISSVKQKHHDATHNCSAYMIGDHNQIQKASDNGEPSGTAGVPILEVLKKQDLKDTAVVITRYFGGIKLGAGGLIRAYSSTTSLAIQTTGIIKRALMHGISVTVDYTLLGKLDNVLRNSEHILDNIYYREHVEFIVYVKVSEEQAFVDWMRDLTSDQAELKMLNKAYISIPQ